MTAHGASAILPDRRPLALGAMLILMAITWFWCFPAQAAPRHWSGGQPARQFLEAVDHAWWLSPGERAVWRARGEGIGGWAVKAGLNPWLVSDVGRACVRSRLRPKEFEAYCRQMANAAAQGRDPARVVSHLLAAHSAGPGHHPAPPPERVSRRDFRDTLRAWEGTPFRPGGSSRWGADETGFIQAVYAAHGLHLPGSPHKLARMGRPVAHRHLTLGDLVVITGPGGEIAYLGIYLEDGWVMRANRRGGVQRVHVPWGRGRGYQVAGRRLLNLTDHGHHPHQAQLG